MTISSSLNAGVAGLSANATRLATISDNIANASTFGYKRAATEFESMVLSAGGGGGKYSAGGVRASSQRLIDEQGGLVGTSNALDIAVAGRGMLPVMPAVRLTGNATGAQPMLMTTTGSFRMDKDGVLRTDSGLVLMGVPADRNGNIPDFSRDTTSGLRPVVIATNQTAADPTTTVSLAVNLPAAETNVGSPGGEIPLRVEYYTNTGTAQSLGLSFTPVVPVAPATAASNSWTLEVTDSALGGAVIGTYTLVFDTTGTAGGTLASVTTVTGGAYDPATGAMTLPVAATGGPIALTIGRIGEPGGLTQLGDKFVPGNVSKNGSPTGTLTGLEIDENGYLMASFDTGFIRRVYQIPLVDVPNLNGLTALSAQTFEISSASGAFFLWNAGEGPTGSIQGFAREGSTTDIAAELTALITTQRAYSSNAKVIQTVDEMLQETTNIKR
ncbi:flagellar hook-basal body complex protein [Pseudotabrizicola sediminis]|uniref:Flagellar hook protein FlgE n=1 Tax=Pseudotabrizicola sediminis TaxID=2486418 RepID=A0ABY2KQN1_9RHOB|nr:flagellar hook-basal body complex protein [Pseudotabrizicola sediminis]TGD43802.1 flagellar hook-basal body complex protein [Pseudotabrizicola sediminis]TGD65671.1 flagellar hook-basal body complex protein [Tabrizicola sp. WMC-M-20]